MFSFSYIYLYKRGKSPRAAKTAEIFKLFSQERERETEREKERYKAETEKERKKAETERERQKQRVGHMQGMGSPACNL